MWISDWAQVWRGLNAGFSSVYASVFVGLQGSSFVVDWGSFVFRVGACEDLRFRADC